MAYNSREANRAKRVLIHIPLNTTCTHKSKCARALWGGGCVVRGGRGPPPPPLLVSSS